MSQDETTPEPPAARPGDDRPCSSPTPEALQAGSGAAARVKPQVLRQCVSCRGMVSKLELIRLVKVPGGEVLLDQRGNLSGRGAYVCRRSTCVDRALGRRLLERALKRPVPPAVALAVTEVLRPPDPGT